MLWKCCTQYVSRFEKLNSDHRTGKGQFSFQSQRKAMSNNVQTTAQLHPSHASKIMLKILQARLQQYVNHQLQMFKLDLEKAEEPDIKLPSSVGSLEKFQKNIYFCFIDYAKAFDCVDCNKLWKNFQEMGIPGHLTCLLRNMYAGQEPTVRTGHGITDWFQ